MMQRFVQGFPPRSRDGFQRDTVPDSAGPDTRMRERPSLMGRGEARPNVATWLAADGSDGDRNASSGRLSVPDAFKSNCHSLSELDSPFASWMLSSAAPSAQHLPRHRWTLPP